MDAFLVVLGVAVLCTFYLAGYSIYTVLKLEKKFSDLNLRAIRTADHVIDLQGKTKKCLQNLNTDIDKVGSAHRQMMLAHSSNLNRVENRIKSIGKFHNWAILDDDKKIIKRTFDQHCFDPVHTTLIAESAHKKTPGIVKTYFYPMDLEFIAGSHFSSAVYEGDQIVSDILFSGNYEEAMESHKFLEKQKVSS